VSKYFRLLSKATGLNNHIGPTKVRYDVQTGIGDLCLAVNVKIGNEGQIERRDGLTATARTEASHSLFTGNSDTLFVAGSSLYALNTDFTRQMVATGLTLGYKAAYCEVQDKIYYCNGRQKGYVQSRTEYPWTVGTYVGPVTHRVFSSTPIGTALALYRGRMYIAENKTLWYSEPFAYSAFDLARNYIWFEDKITTILPVEEGIFVSAGRIFFLAGKNPTEFLQTIVSSYPVVGQTGVTVLGEELLDKSFIGKCALWTSQNGVFFGRGDGQILNLTKDRLDLPPIGGGSAVFHNGAYLALLSE